MEVKVKQLKEKSQAELAISVPVKDFEAYIERAAKELTRDKPLKGFRPGKAPLAVVIEVFGQERVLHEAMERALPHFFVQAALDEDVEAVNKPSVTITTLGMDKPFEFTATVDVLPAVQLADVKQLKIEKRDVAVKDEEVEQELNHLAKLQAKPLEVLRGAQTGDLVTVDFSVLMNGAPIEGGSSKNHPIQLGEGHFVPDFEKGIVGVKAGEERTFEIAFPPDYSKKEIAGQKAHVQLKAHSVQQMILPKMDDDFAKSLGKFENMAALKGTLKENMQHEKDHKESDRRRSELMEKLAEASTFGVIPEVLIEREIDSRLQELAHMLTLQQKSIDDYLKRQNKTVEQLRADLKTSAEKAVKVGIAMRAFAKEQNTEVTDEEIEAQAQEYLARFKDEKSAAKQINPNKLREDITLVLRNQKALDKLEELAGFTPHRHTAPAA